ncbi:MAG: ABC transporter substrate-binding protein [Protaetiibacter sp.]
MHKQRRFAVLAAAVVAAALTACSTPASTGDGDEDSAGAQRVAFVTGMINEPFYVLMQQGAEAKAEELGIDLDYQGATVWDPSAQIPIFDSVRATDPDFLIAIPVEKTALLSAIQAYGDAGIPVITVDTDLEDTSARLTNITSDNYEGGVAAAQELAKVVDEKGKVAILCYQPGITVNDLRLQGFEDEIAKHPDIEYVGPQLMQGADPNESIRYFDAVLQAHPDIAGVVTCADVATTGVVASLKEKGLVGDVKLVGFDADEDLYAAVREGVVSGLVVQQTMAMGAASVQWAYDYLNGDNPSTDDLKFPFVPVDADNVDTEEALALIGK